MISKLIGMMNIILLNGNNFKLGKGPMELTLSIIKPDAVKRNLSGSINQLIQKNKIKIVAQKMMKLSILESIGSF